MNAALSPTIATWFVADDGTSATYFPQVGSRSDAPAAQAVYWRCTACFFASSIVVNPSARHVFYTNTQVPVVDGIDIAELFAMWGVEVVTLPITYRLPKGAVSSWGNQFYIFDVLAHYATSSSAAPLIVLDSDCIWVKSADTMVVEIANIGALTYFLGHDEHPEGEAINGLTRAGMAEFLAANGGPRLGSTPYFGGEIYAASAALTRAISARARALWPQVMTQAAAAPREEAHFLSILYALEGVGLDRGSGDTANRFIRRMWTTFHHNNLAAADRDLSIWHLPAEKRTGFADLFAMITRDASLHPARNAAAMGLHQQCYDRVMGFPRRSLRKFVRDFSLKLREKLKF